MVRVITALVLLVVPVALARADWDPWEFTDHAAASPSGRWSATLRRVHGTYRTRAEFRDRLGTGRVLGRFVIDGLPRTTMVTDSPPRLVLIDKLHTRSPNRVITVIAPSGKRVVRIGLRALFDGRDRRLPRSVSHVHWSCGYFVDRGHLVVMLPRGTAPGEWRGHPMLSPRWASDPDVLVAISLADGSMHEPCPSSAVRCALDRASPFRAAAMAVARKARAPGVVPVAARVAFDPVEPWDLRIEAAAAAALLGADGAARSLVLFAAGSASVPRSGRRLAIRHLGRVVGFDAMPLMRTLLERPGPHVWDVDEALADLGAAIEPTMLAWLEESSGGAFRHTVAARRLGALNARTAVEPLFRATRRGPEMVATAAVDALATIGPSNLVDRLCGLLLEGGPSVLAIARYFESNPTTRARDALELACRRLEAETRDSAAHAAVRRALCALRKCIADGEGSR